MGERDLSKACPLPPGHKRPRRTIQSRIIDIYDRLLSNRAFIISLLAIASILLAHGFLITPPPPIVREEEPESWSRPIPEYTFHPLPEVEWTPKFKRQIIYEGHIVLENNDTIEVSEASLILKGTMLVKDNASLIIRNGEFFIEEKRSWTPKDPLPFLCQLLFNNSAKFETYNTSIYSPMLIMVFLGDSKAMIKSFNSSFSIIYADENSTIKIENSNINGIYIANNAYCSINKSNIGYIAPKSIKNYMLCNKRINILNNSNVEVWNSTIDRLIILMKNATIILDKPILGFHRYWNTYSGLNLMGEAFNITLYNTNITDEIVFVAIRCKFNVITRDDIYGIHIYKGVIRILNSSLIFLNIDNSLVEINGSVFENVILRGSDDVKIADSKIERLDLEDFNGNIKFDRVLINDIFIHPYCIANISGYIKFGSDFSTIESWTWLKGVVNRVYKIYAEMDGRALPGVKLTLYDDEGDVIWRGETGRDGGIHFNVSFYKLWSPKPFTYITNYDKTYRLEARWRDFTYNVSINILTETPIIISFPKSVRLIYRYKWIAITIGASIIIFISINLLLNRFGHHIVRR